MTSHDSSSILGVSAEKMAANKQLQIRSYSVSADIAQKGDCRASKSAREVRQANSKRPSKFGADRPSGDPLAAIPGDRESTVAL